MNDHHRTIYIPDAINVGVDIQTGEQSSKKKKKILWAKKIQVIVGHPTEQSPYLLGVRTMAERPSIKQKGPTN